MAVSKNRVYRLTNYCEFLGQSVVNVYWYGADDGAPVSAATVIDYWQSFVRDEIRDIQTSDVNYLLAECVDVNDISDYASEVQSVTGSVAGAPEPSFVTLSFRGPQVLYGWKRPAKRIGGIPDEWIAGNQVVAGSSAITAVANALGATIDAAGSNLYPLVVRKPTPLPGFGIPLPWPDTPINYVANGWAFHRVGTQNSRKSVGA